MSLLPSRTSHTSTLHSTLMYPLQTPADPLSPSSPHHFVLPARIHQENHPVRHPNGEPPHQEPQAQPCCASHAVWDGRTGDGRRGCWGQGQASRCGGLIGQWGRGNVGSGTHQRAVEEGHLVRPLVTHLSRFLNPYRCRNDAKTVSIIALGCFHPVTKVQSASLHFFLGSDEEKEDSDDEEEDVCALRPRYSSI